LGRLLRQNDPVARELASAALANVGRDAEPAVPDLVKALGDAQAPVRRNSALAIGNVAKAYVELESRAWPGAGDTVRDLAKLLKPADPNEEVRRYAAEAFNNYGEAVEGAIPELVHAAKEGSSPIVRQRAVWALRQVRAVRAQGLVPPLTEILGTTEEKYFMSRYDAARVLAMKLQGEAPEKAADVLVQMLRDRRVRIYTGSSATVRGGPGEKVDPGAKVQETLGRDARFLAADALKLMGPAANKPAVLEALMDRENWKDPETKQLNPEMEEKCREAARRIGGR